MDWMLPGVPPTGKQVVIPVNVTVLFEGDKVKGERILWDQASVLVQLVWACDFGLDTICTSVIVANETMMDMQMFGYVIA